MKTKAIIICAGNATRWNNYMGVAKHLIEIDGERILDRTVRLLNERGIKDVFVVVKRFTKQYRTNGSKQVIANLNPEKNVDADKFLSSKSYWNRTGRTIVIYGDCYFTEDAMDTIVNFDKKEWTLFCRPDASSITGTPWGECFAQSFYPEHIAQHESALHYVADLFKRGVIERCGGWEHYNAMIGKKESDVAIHGMVDHYVEINDWTDDFDYPEDYENWVKNRALLNS